MVRLPSARSLAAAAAVGLLALSLAASADPDPKLARLFSAKCGSCHGKDGKGADEGKKLGVKDLTSAEVQKASDADLIAAVTNGKKAEGKAEGMDPFKEKLTPEQISSLIGFVRTLK